MFNFRKIFSNSELPLIYQTEKTDCALSCIAMIANFYDISLQLEELKRIFPEYKKGTNLNDIYNILSSYSMNVRVLSVDIDELSKVKLPCIIHWDNDHFVVLKKIKNDKLIIHDPERGILNFGYRKFTEHFTGILIEAYPGIVTRQGKNAAVTIDNRGSYSSLKSIKFFANLLSNSRTILFSIIILLIIIEFVNIILPQITQLVIDQVIVNNDEKLLLIAIAGYFILSIIQLFVSSARDWLMIWISAHLGYQLPLAFLGKIMSLPVNFFNSRGIGDLISRFDSVDIIKNTATTQLLTTLLDIIMMLAAFIMLIIYDHSLAIVVISIVLLYGIIKLCSYKVYKYLNVGTLKSKARQQGAMIESIRNHQLLKLYPECNGIKSNFVESLVDVINNQAKIGYIQVVFSASNLLLSSLKNVFILYLGGLQVMSGNFSIGMLVAFISYSEQFCRRSMRIVDFMMQSYMTGVHIDRINEVLYSTSETEGIVQKSINNSSSGLSLELKKISFSYPSSATIFSDVSFRINPGETLLISGRSGCGKSTLIKIILGLFIPSNGHVLCNDIHITMENIQSFRKLIGTVLQGDTLLNGTLLYNITFDTDTSLEEVIPFTSGLGIHDVINNLPMGYYSQVSDINAFLSIGQIQRILLARALFRRPALLILDEATSNLDKESELLILDYISRINCTKIIISHKDEVFRIANKLLIIDNTAAHFYENPQEHKDTRLKT
ncbi:peptidase domain-containing ABC transporter [Yersinia enterocolitica]|uniref:peptidase domain-containing ABC transporter n=1 Tax=Yersinia enterocolitica TaxID=630 RepID=UPI003F4201DE|nr:peptidase domain-containing ABC transporter [Yersinia enterocolitica]